MPASSPTPPASALLPPPGDSPDPPRPAALRLRLNHLSAFKILGRSARLDCASAMLLDCLPPPCQVSSPPAPAAHRTTPPLTTWPVPCHGLGPWPLVPLPLFPAPEANPETGLLPPLWINAPSGPFFNFPLLPK